MFMFYFGLLISHRSNFKSRENERTEREALGPALGICHVYESYL